MPATSVSYSYNTGVSGMPSNPPAMNYSGYAAAPAAAAPPPPPMTGADGGQYSVRPPPPPSQTAGTEVGLSHCGHSNIIWFVLRCMNIVITWFHLFADGVQNKSRQ